MPACRAEVRILMASSPGPEWLIFFWAILPTLAEARASAQHALDLLAAPGPADSASKRLHTAERQATAEAKQLLKRHLTKTARFLAGFR